MLGKNTILKAIHNFCLLIKHFFPVWMLGKNTILKAIHNTERTCGKVERVWMLGKNTILKAIHNCTGNVCKWRHGVNAR